MPAVPVKPLGARAQSWRRNLESIGMPLLWAAAVWPCSPQETVIAQTAVVGAASGIAAGRSMTYVLISGWCSSCESGGNAVRSTYNPHQGNQSRSRRVKEVLLPDRQSSVSRPQENGIDGRILYQAGGCRLHISVDLTLFKRYARCSDQRGSYASLFFSEDPYDMARAKAICAQCVARPQCLEGAVARAEPCGVWGGEIFVDGLPVAAKRGRGRPPRVPRPALVVDEVPFELTDLPDVAEVA